MLSILAPLLAAVFTVANPTAELASKPVHIPNTHPLIFYHGRWDSAPETWWSGSGFKLNVRNLQSLTVNLGPNTTQPFVALGVSIDHAPFFSLNATIGANVIPISLPHKTARDTTVVRINAEMYFSSQMHLHSIELNPGAQLVPYVPSKIAFEFIGDSFSTGYTTPDGILNAWDFIVGENFKAEESVVAQPGAALVDIFSFGNAHGMSYQFFKTEDTSYYYSSVHNYTTPWDFRRDVPERTHIVVHIGANDASQNVPQDEFVSTYIDFLARVRKLYPHQPFFLFTPWGWPQPTGPNAFYYDGAYEQVFQARQTLGDHNMFLVNTTGWVTYADVFQDNLHPSVEGHAKIAKLFTAWLQKWGLKPLAAWPNP
ncbi:SGNH hydrolase [Mycena indigotica]|uniref:SGNH hydrolase n=1 Tax=Mycena indigotica TaxID=2126181 RepID=A0A8H6TGB1_9AGAR|nr:SGNH hydrolase [Mycena indigotica]KAF7316222.1 SGNH hydrolase [Mycena indigotica]